MARNDKTACEMSERVPCVCMFVLKFFATQKSITTLPVFDAGKKVQHVGTYRFFSFFEIGESDSTCSLRNRAPRQNSSLISDTKKSIKLKHSLLVVSLVLSFFFYFFVCAFWVE